jgi:hypothetical protein
MNSLQLGKKQDSCRYPFILDMLTTLFSFVPFATMATYDSKDTGWFMLPTDLKLLIEFEREDYNDRVAASRRGISQPRSNLT